MTTAVTSLDSARYPSVRSFLDAYRRGPGASDADALAEHLTKVASRAERREAPFPIATIDNFLPDDLYNEILESWSSLELSRIGRPGAGAGSRRGVELEVWQPGLVASSTVWSRVGKAVRAEPFVRTLFTLFADVVEDNLHDPGVDGGTVPGFRLWANQDQGDSGALSPHIDALPKLLTIVYYLDVRGAVGPESFRRWGTAVYDIEDGSVEPLAFDDPDYKRPAAGHVEFRPNRAFVMPNSTRALHAVLGGEPDVTRRSLMWGYWYTPDGL